MQTTDSHLLHVLNEPAAAQCIPEPYEQDRTEWLLWHEAKPAELKFRVTSRHNSQTQLLSILKFCFVLFLFISHFPP